MKNPTLLKANVNKEQALETMDFLYGWRGIYVDYTPATNDKIVWISDDVVIAKWTEEYKNIMISKDFVEKIKNNY